MGKKSRAKRSLAPSNRPSGELDGVVALIQQFMRDRRYNEAVRAGRTLVETDPLNPRAHAILGSVLADLRSPLEALRQFEMAQRLGMADDPALLRSVALTASMARYPVHAVLAARQGLQQRGLSADLHDLFSSILTSTDAYIAELVDGRPIAPAVAEEAVLLMERSTRELATGQPERARKLAEAAAALTPTWPLMRNHLATLLFSFNDVTGAIDACRHVIEQVEPHNTTVLATLVRLLAASGQHAEAERILATLVGLDNDRLATVEEKARGLAALGQHERIRDLLQPWWQQEPSPMHPLGRYLLGVAAANLGYSDEARQVWHNIWNEGLPQARLYADMLLRKERPPTPTGAFTYYAAAELVPSVLLDELSTRVHPEQDNERLLEIAAAFPFLPEALCETFYAPGVDPRLAVDLLLPLREMRPDVVDAVRAFSTGKETADYNRVYAHIALRADRLEDAAEPATLWINGRRHDLTLPALRLGRREEHIYDPQIRALLDEGLQAQERDDVVAAAAAYRRVLEVDPTVMEAQHNLGTALLFSNDIEGGREQLQQALALDPTHVLARCNLASIALMRGDRETAHALLASLDGQESFTLEEVLGYLRVHADLASADGDQEQAEGYLYAVLAYDPDNALATERLAALAMASPAPR